MARYSYDEFRVTLTGRAEGDYEARVLDLAGVEHVGRFRSPFDAAELEHAVLRLARGGRHRAPPPPLAPTAAGPRRDVGGHGPPDLDAERVGGALAEALFSGEIGLQFQEARRRAAADGRGLRLASSLADAPGLLSLPWEFLYLRPRFLANQRRSPLVRHLATDALPAPPSIEGTVKVLGVVASPRDLPLLDVADERARVERAVATVVELGRVELDWLEPATPRRLRETLRDGNYDVLHYVGHSDFSPEGDGVLFLESVDGRAARVDGTELANLLSDQARLRLVVLNSCEGARTTLTDPFAGVATTLIQLGVPAVVAMQFEISDEAAILFAEELYTNLIGRQSPIDAAVAEARKAIYIEMGSLEWATPVLFMGDTDVELFHFEVPAAPLPPPPGPAPAATLPPDEVERHERVDGISTPVAGGATTQAAAPVARPVSAAAGPQGQGASYSLGIDVGTTYTAAAIFRDGKVEAFPLATYQVAVPSVVFAAGGEFLFGAPAARRGATQPDGLAREFKRRLGDPVPLMLSGSPYHADRLTALMAKWVVDTVSEQVGEQPERIVMTHPANWTQYQLGVLANALHDVGLGRVEMLSEPAAAALDYAAATAVDDGALLLVYDLGGGTFDVALLRRGDGGFEHEIDPFGIERLGGIDFDEAVFHFVIGQVPAETVEAARQSPEGLAALANLRRSCVEAKESLSSDPATDIPVMLPGHTSTVRITRGELEEMIQPMVQQTIAGVSDTLARAKVEPVALTAALLVGGSSRIPLVPQMVAEQLGVPVRIDAHPKLVVAKGAARHAGSPAPRRVVGAPRQVVWDVDDDGDGGGPDRRWWVAAAVAAVGVAGVGGWLLTRDDDPAQSSQTTTIAESPTTRTAAPTTTSTEPTPTSTTPVTVAGPVAFTVVDQCPTEPSPHDIAVVGTDLWVTPARTDSLQRCDTTQSSPRPDTVALGPGVQEGAETGHQIVPTPGALYITRRHAAAVDRVDLSDMSIDSIPIEGSPFGAALLGDTIWVTSNTEDPASPGRLTPIDINTATAGPTINLPYFPGHVRAIGDELWVAYLFNDKLGRVDPTTGTVGELDSPGAPFDMLEVGDEVWVTLWQGNQVARIDPATGDVVGLIEVGAGPYMLIEAFGSIWVSNGGASPGSISRIDPATLREVQPPIEVGASPVALAADDDRLYVGNYGGESVSVLAPEE